MVPALRKAGGKPGYTEHAVVAHNSWTRAYAAEALWTWMYAQRKVGVAEPSRADEEQ